MGLARGLTEFDEGLWIDGRGIEGLSKNYRMEILKGSSSKSPCPGHGERHASNLSRFSSFLTAIHEKSSDISSYFE